MIPKTNTQDTLFVTVIIPTYNAKDTVYRCVRSAIAQRYSTMEILVVDDGSVDGTVKMLQQLQGEDKRLKVIKTEHQGYVATLRTALQAAQGEWVTVLRDTDWVESDFLLSLTEQIHTETELVMGGFYQQRGQSERSYSASEYQPALWGKLIQRRLLDEVVGDESADEKKWVAMLVEKASALSFSDKGYYHHWVSNRQETLKEWLAYQIRCCKNYWKK